MQLTQDQIEQYHADGLLTVEAVFSPDEVELLNEAYWRDVQVPGDHRLRETSGEEIRAVYASHLRQPEFAALIRDPRLLSPVKQLLVDDVYVYQLKINAKPAFGGDKWAWHQDFLAWKLADNLPAPRQVNAVLFLDEVNEYNGPIIFVPGSHRNGLVHKDRHNGPARSTQHLDPDDISLNRDQMAALVQQYGMFSPKGPAGSVLFFHSEVVHGSSQNMSPFQRRLLIVTYNDSANRPQPVGKPRPEYVVGQDYTPLQLLEMPLMETVVGGAK